MPRAYGETKFTIPRFDANEAPDVSELRCVTVFVPDDVEYVRILAAMVALTTQRTNWEGAEDDRVRRAEMCLVGYLATDWDGCMDCDGVADCIETDEGVQDAIAEAIRNNINIQNAIAETYNPLAQGANPPASVTGAPLYTPVPDCDLNTLFGQIDSLIEHMATNNTDAQEIIESQTNVVERAKILLSGLPGIGILPIDEIIGYVQGLWSDDLIEAYNANDTEAYRDEVKCALFCIARDHDCALSIDDVYTYFGNRLSVTLDDTLEEIINYLILGTWTGTEVNDLFFLAQCLFIKNGNKFFPIIGLKTFGVMMALGEPSDDWLLLCDVCVSGWSHRFNATDGWGDWGAELDTLLHPIGELVGGVWEGRDALIGATPAFGVWIRNATAIGETFNVAVRYSYTHGDGSYGQNTVTSAGFAGFPAIIEGDNVINASADLAASAYGIGIEFLSQFGGTVTGSVTIFEIVVSADTGIDPY
jgi:hypothetical protein